MSLFESPAYKRSRKAYMMQSTIEYFISLLVADAFLASLLTHIGISDALVGIISSFITLAFAIQLLSIFIVRLKISAKKLVLVCDTVSIFFFMLLYLIPFMPVDKPVKVLLVILSFLLAYGGKYLILNICFTWANAYVNPENRGSFSAGKEMLSLFSGMIFTVLIGYAVDRFESIGNLSGGFLFIASTMLVLNLANFISLMLIKKEEPAEEENPEPFSSVLKHILSNKNFCNVIILTVLWDVARYFTVGFLGTFKYKELAMTILMVQVVNNLSSLMRIAVSKPLGKYSDRHSYAKGFKLGLYLAAGGFFINMFTTPDTWYLIILHTVLYNCAFSGTNQNSFNIIYSYVEEKYIVQAMAIKNCIGGICGFGASLLGGWILKLVQSRQNILFGVPIFGQQILSGVSFLVTLFAIIFIKKVIEKQKIMIQ